LDAEAKRQKRSRSFVVAEAIRRYVAQQESQVFAGARNRTIDEGLALTPAGRVQLAEDLWQDFAHGHRVTKPWTATFNTFDEYERWRRQGEGRRA
jgi:predicted transcriptional regulator